MGANTNYEYQIFIQTNDGLQPFYKVGADDCLSEALEHEVENAEQVYNLRVKEWLQIYNRIYNWILQDRDAIDSIDEEIDQYKELIDLSNIENEIEAIRVGCEFIGKRYAEIYEIERRIEKQKKAIAFLERIIEVEHQREQYYKYYNDVENATEKEYKPMFSVMRILEN